MDFSWAENYPEVHKVCTLFSLSELSNPNKYTYKPLPAFVQDGPQCGLVALAMYSGAPTKDSVQSIFETARAEEFTYNGEMFSAQNMANLAQIYLKTAKVDLYTGYLDTEEIRDVLLQGACLLVPYDSDKDNSPSLQNGLKAHWAVISGAVKTETDFYILARHGKARNVAIWKLEDLAASNAQLNEVGVYLKNPEIEFKLPEGGIQGPMGLKCKTVILR